MNLFLMDFAAAPETYATSNPILPYCRASETYLLRHDRADQAHERLNLLLQSLRTE